MSVAFASVFALLLTAAPAFATAPPGEVAPQSEQTELQELLKLQRTELQAMRGEIRAQREQLEKMRSDVAANTPTTSSPSGERVTYGDPIRVEAGEDVQDVVSFGNHVFVAGRVRGDATAFGGNIEVADGGVIDGDANAFGGEIIVDSGGTVRGDRVAMAVSNPRAATNTPRVQAAGSLPAVQGMWTGLYHRLILLLSFAGAGVLVVGLMPGRVTRIAESLEARPFRSAFVGIFASGFLSMSSVLFAITILGLPVSFVLVSLLGLAWLIGLVGLCQAVGDRLPFENNQGRWVAFLIASVLLTCMGSLPWVGWLVVMGASVLGIGAALSTRFGGR